MGGNISVGLQPWKTGLVTLTSYYDSIRYNNMYLDVSANDSNTFGYGIELEQYLSSALKTSIKYSARTFYDRIQASIQFFHNIRHDKAAIGISLGISRTNYNTLNATDAANSNENAITFGLQYYFTPIRHTYTMPSFNFDSLTSWVSNPAVRMETVLAAADQKVAQVAMNWVGSLNVDQNSANHSATLSWGKVTTNTPNASISYILDVQEGGQSISPYPKAVSGSSKQVVTALQDEKEYTATITATEEQTQQSVSTTVDFMMDLVWSNPSLTFNNTTGDSTTLSWNPATTTKSGDTIHYSLKVINTDTGKTVYDGSITPMSNNSYLINDLESDTHYTTILTATDDYENSISAGGDGSGDVTTLVALSWANPNVAVDLAGDGAATVSWNSAKSNFSGGIISYNVVVKDQTNQIVETHDVGNTDTSIGLTTLYPNTTYTVIVTAKDNYDDVIQAKDEPFTTNKGAFVWDNPNITVTKKKDNYEGYDYYISWNKAELSPGAKRAGDKGKNTIYVVDLLNAEGEVINKYSAIAYNDDNVMINWQNSIDGIPSVARVVAKDSMQYDADSTKTGAM